MKKSVKPKQKRVCANMFFTFKPLNYLKFLNFNTV